MNQKTFDLIAGVLFFLIALGHLLRGIFGWTAVVAGFAVPVWWSWVAFVVVGYLAFVGLRVSRTSS
jgi:hypothetical protein